MKQTINLPVNLKWIVIGILVGGYFALAVIAVQSINNEGDLTDELGKVTEQRDAYKQGADQIVAAYHNMLIHLDSISGSNGRLTNGSLSVIKDWVRYRDSVANSADFAPAIDIIIDTIADTSGVMP